MLSLIKHLFAGKKHYIHLSLVPHKPITLVKKKGLATETTFIFKRYSYKGYNYINKEYITTSSKQVDKYNRPTTQARLAQEKIAVLERDEWKCVKCENNKYLTIDHIVEGKYKRGSFQPYPLHECQTLCVDCHIIKTKEYLSRRKIQQEIQEFNNKNR